MKICSLCKEEKELSNFSSNGKGSFGPCKPCSSKKASAWNKSNPEKRRVNSHRHKMKSQYGLTPEDVARMTEDQNGKCLICEMERKLVVDHSHISGKVRGLLCRQCNSGIGQLQDSAAIMRRAIEYVIKNS